MLVKEKDTERLVLKQVLCHPPHMWDIGRQFLLQGCLGLLKSTTSLAVASSGEPRP
jgi:hypothetical protein